MAVRRVPRRFGYLSERGGQLVDIVALQRVGDPAKGAGLCVFFLAVWPLVRLNLPAYRRTLLSVK
jgi:hypothetical protein